MSCRTMRVSDECLVRNFVEPQIACSIQFYGSEKFAIVRVDPSTARDGQAEAVVISGSFANEKDAWTDARMRLGLVR